jgi:hypothetical protein
MIYRYSGRQKHNLKAQRLNQADTPGLASNLFDNRSTKSSWTVVQYIVDATAAACNCCTAMRRAA